MPAPWRFVFDVESIGLYGEGFAFGAVLFDEGEREVRSWLHACDPGHARGDGNDRDWVMAHVKLPEFDRQSPREVRTEFYAALKFARLEGGPDLQVWADWFHPVESEFLRRMFRDDETRFVPTPIHEIASIVALAGGDEAIGISRLADLHELPEHNPLADARWSARRLRAAVRLLSTHHGQPS